MARQDDPSLSGELVLYRRIPPKGDRVVWDESGNPTPSSQNFRDKENQLSVYIAREADVDHILAGHNGYGLVQFTAQKVRDILGPGFVICRDDLEPGNGHVLICGNFTNGLARKLKGIATWVEGRLPERLNPDRW